MNKKYIAIHKLYPHEHGGAFPKYWVFWMYLEGVRIHCSGYNSSFKHDTSLDLHSRIFILNGENPFDKLERHFNGTLESYDSPDVFTPINSQQELDRYFMVEELLR